MPLSPLRPGDPGEIGGYVLSGRLGAGGQGTVFLGHAADGAPVAVKLLHARFDGDGRARARFAREIGAARRVASARTARVLAADAGGPHPYLVAEYIDGPSLAEAVRVRGPLAGGDLAALAAGAAAALAAIHGAGVAHRDLKPSNVLLADGGPRVVDFGIARAADAATASTSLIMGTPAYMAPEQVGGAEVGPPADVFAWGATVAYAATGRPPFGCDTVPAVFHRITTAEPDLGGLDGPLRAVVAAALAKDPAARPSAGDLVRMLRDGTAPPPAAPRALRWRFAYVPPSARVKAGAWTAAAAAFAVAALAVLVAAPGLAKLGALLLVPPLGMAYPQIVRPRLRTGAAGLAADASGLTFYLDDATVRWAWAEIERLDVHRVRRPPAPGRERGGHWAVYAERALGAGDLHRLPRRFGHPSDRRDGDLLFPLGPARAPHVEAALRLLEERTGRALPRPHGERARFP
ncbi:protein kinase domain-containing protein [Actinomadura parmotrematis]|uniref:Serine/threonine protein kinase n=1 Tax=Actinomadura parmotrematis TaxID=2864039 RepID=A0ABS7FPV0_9ACTN|nr:serine/threonine-protein kinase [Actinomadura parmotrematis]MBW8482386.1 serine/threonine protein kinase [Actinomadura parmotrematis]